MPNIELLLLALTFSISIGTPIYIYFRNKMVKDVESKKTVRSPFAAIKSTLVVFLIMLFISTVFLVVLITIYLKQGSMSVAAYSYMGIFFILLFSSYYGSGIYVTSIMLEFYTLPQLRDLKQFKTQFIATHIFHGPISHLLIYSSLFYAFMMLAFFDLELSNGYSMVINPYVMSMFGGILGIFFGISQIYNGTAPYQLLSTAISFLYFFGVCSIRFPQQLLNSPTGMYFAGAVTAAFITLVTYLLYVTSIEKEKVNWDASGY